MMKKHLLVFALVIISIKPLIWAQNNQIIEQTLTWKNKTIRQANNKKIETSTFQNASWESQTPTLPHFYTMVPVSSFGNVSITLQNPVFESFDRKPSDDDAYINSNIVFDGKVLMERNNYKARIHCIPIRKTAQGNYERLVRFQLKIQVIPSSLPTVDKERGGPVENSILRDGLIYKVAIENSGIQRVDAKMLKDAGIDISKINPKKIKIYGNAGGTLPESNASFRYEDLSENPCVVNGESDGQFNDGDNITFFAYGADKWSYNSVQKIYNMKKNVYSFNSFYFIKFDGEDGKRIQNKSNVSGTPDYTTSNFNDFQRHELERINILDKYESTPGGGQKWFGEEFISNKKTIKIPDFIFPNVVKNSTANIKAELAYRSSESGSYDIEVNNLSFSKSLSSCGSCNEETLYASLGVIEDDFKITQENLSVTVNINSNKSDMKGFLDYIQINALRQLVIAGNQMFFRDINTLDKNIVRYDIANANGFTIWNVSDPINPQAVTLSNNSFLSQITNKAVPEEFIAFNSNTGFQTPKLVGKIANQNLHAIANDIEMIIVHSKALEGEAKRLADHRITKNKLKVKTILIDEIYNEFSSGAVDVSAIRDFTKFLYEKDSRFKYLLLFGDGSFNYRNINASADEISKNHIPPYETEESEHVINTFPSDDYYALLSPNEGVNLQGLMDIAVGRITAYDTEMAKAIVDKIINYDSNPDAMRDYRNRLLLITDDYEPEATWEEVFLEHSEKLDQYSRKVYNTINAEKIYLQAFPQIPTPSGPRSPDANQAINNNMFKGSLLLNYIGHGGPRGWTQERILNASVDVPSWTNLERLPLFVTATCSFGAYDSPSDFTAGEQILALDKGGAMALYSTVRAVYSSDNDALTSSLFNVVYEKNGYNGKNIGDILLKAKNNTFASVDNTRKFALLGDPSQRLMLPQYKVFTTKINGKDATSTVIDTIGALDKLFIEGYIGDSTGNVLTSFNGLIYPTIFDKSQKQKTIPIGGTDQTYELQNKILFKGTATVTNGKFKFNCVIPKDINYDYGFGKVSYYATDEKIDAAGYENKKIVIGGVGKNALTDNLPPKVEVFIDNEQFVSGGTVSANPTLLVRLTDDFGINVSGNSVGHDPLAVLDNDTKNSYRLNDFYQSLPDQPAKGRIEYPLFKLSEGQHEIKVRAWDTSNNVGEGSTIFVVAANGKSALEHVLNYPNPFTTNTNFQFRHHLSEINLNVMVQIFTISGKLVKTIDTNASSRGGIVDDIAYDGKDDYGNDLAKGVYIYKVKIRSARNSSIGQESDFEKMVILK